MISSETAKAPQDGFVLRRFFHCGFPLHAEGRASAGGRALRRRKVEQISPMPDFARRMENKKGIDTMKTLILNGSPRPQGDTAALIRAFREELKGEVRQIDAYRARISPCVDCRACMQGDGCRIKDDMEQIYQAAAQADALVIASPLYFSTLTGPLLSLCSRFQSLYAARRQGLAQPGEKKAGVALLVGGGSTKDPAWALGVASIILRELGAPLSGQVFSLHTDKLPAAQDEAALAEARKIAQNLNRLGGE